MKNILWNVPSINCPIYELAYLWNVFIYEMSYLWNVLSMDYEMSFDEMSLDEMSQCLEYSLIMYRARV